MLQSCADFDLEGKSLNFQAYQKGAACLCPDHSEAEGLSKPIFMSQIDGGMKSCLWSLWKPPSFQLLWALEESPLVFPKGKMPLNLPVFISLSQHSKSLCLQLDWLCSSVTSTLATTHSQPSFLTPAPDGQSPTVPCHHLSEVHWESLKPRILVSAAPQSPRTLLFLRSLFKDFRCIKGKGDWVKWHRSCPGLLSPQLCFSFWPKASCFAQSLWLSVTITLIETEFLKVISPVLYLTMLPTPFYIIWHIWQLPPTHMSHNNPRTHSNASLNVSLPGFCRVLGSPSTSVLFSLRSSHLSSYTSSETYVKPHCGPPFRPNLLFVEYHYHLSFP